MKQSFQGHKVKEKLSNYLLFASLFCLLYSLCASATAQNTFIRFKHAPFPYQDSANVETPFFDVIDQGRRGHTSLRGGVYWEDERYVDNRVLISIPSHFRRTKPAVIVVFLHGNLATLERDVLTRQGIPEQVATSGLNAVLVAPQFAVDALDSSPGHFADNNYFEKFLFEVAVKIGRWKKNRAIAESLKNAKVIIVAYSGGYQAAAAILENGGANDRIAGIVLLDALYGREQTFADLFTNNPRSFLVSTFTEAARIPNENLKSLLQTNNKIIINNVPEKILPGTFSFSFLGPDVDHYTLLEGSWIEKPLTDILRRVDLHKRKN